MHYTSFFKVVRYETKNGSLIRLSETVHEKPVAPGVNRVPVLVDDYFHSCPTEIAVLIKLAWSVRC